MQIRYIGIQLLAHYLMNYLISVKEAKKIRKPINAKYIGEDVRKQKL